MATEWRVSAISVVGPCDVTTAFRARARVSYCILRPTRNEFGSIVRITDDERHMP